MDIASVNGSSIYMRLSTGKRGVLLRFDDREHISSSTRRLGE
ncbi:hypothetical protein [Sorangium sp. So ce381]